MPYFSVVLITYNRADLLPRCINSVISQTFTDWELIVVDNYSEDGTKDLIENYIAKDNRIKFLQIHNNNVLSVSRNAGIKIAKGKYICILDSDDWYTNDKLRAVYDVCQKKEYDVIYNKYQFVSQKGQGRICGEPLTWDDKFYELLMEGSSVCNTTVVVKKEAVVNAGYLSEDPKLRAVEDVDLWLRIAKQGRDFHFIDKCLGFYWVGDNMSYSEKQITQVNNLYDKYIPEIESSKLKACLTCRDYTIARFYHKIGNFKKALELYLIVFPSQRLSRKVKTIYHILCASFKIIS